MLKQPLPTAGMSPASNSDRSTVQQRIEGQHAQQRHTQWAKTGRMCRHGEHEDAGSASPHRQSPQDPPRSKHGPPQVSLPHVAQVA